MFMCLQKIGYNKEAITWFVQKTDHFRSRIRMGGNAAIQTEQMKMIRSNYSYRTVPLRARRDSFITLSQFAVTSSSWCSRAGSIVRP